MKISCTGFTRPSCLLINPELSALTFCKPQLTYMSTPQLLTKCVKKIRFITMFQHSVASGRTHTSSSLEPSLPKQDTIHVGQKQGGSFSLYIYYSQPSLSQMKNERRANRAQIYDFSRSIGIVPDELEGLELPVTVEVLRELVDFLHQLVLTIDDINDYPLVLGCSVKKNMIPVLDYLGKLGVRKSTFTDILRRYPQVLHASVVVGLAPAVKFLQGLDTKPNDIPRVLEKYPEVLGFKLEGTMSTSVAYLVGIGIGRKQIGGILTRFPEILGMKVGRVIKPFVEFLESLGIPSLAVARLIEQRPHIVGLELEERVKPNVDALLENEVRRSKLASVIAQYHEIIGIDVKSKLLSQRTFLNSLIDLNPEDFGRVVEKMPQVVSLNNNSMLKHVDFIKACGFSLQQVRKMVLGCPQLLALNLGIMKHSFDFFQVEMGRDLEELVDFPVFFTYSLESTVKPRHHMVAARGFKCSLAWLLNCSEEKFKERMDYEFIEMEEMETVPSFDMSSLTKPSADESDYDEEESDDEYL